MIYHPLKDSIFEDLNRHKMVFIAGPRQVGKTRLSWELLEGVDKYKNPEDHPGYFNWDDRRDRDKILNLRFPSDTKRLVFDEIHKFEGWRGFLKGLFDKHGSKYQIVVTGSARLDYYRRGGDSLQGRYFFYRLHPLSFVNLQPKPTLAELLDWGGFPEPALERNARFYNRWQNLRRSRLIQEDLITLEKVRELAKVDMLMTLLPSRVGSILSINSLREDLGVGHDTASHWIEILENLYFCFRISPYTHDAIKGMKKEKKLFLWDWSLTKGGARIENFVASMLYKYCHWQEDVHGESLQLKFLRDKEKRELDFLVCKNGEIIFAVECKSGDNKPAKNLRYFTERLAIPIIYQVHTQEDDYVQDDLNLRVLPVETFVTDILGV